MSYLYVTYMSLLICWYFLLAGARAHDDKHHMELRGTLQRLKMAPRESMVAWRSYLHENHKKSYLNVDKYTIHHTCIVYFI